MSKTIEERVFDAAEALHASGQKVTNESVRQKIGGGSLRDVGPALRSWREQQKNSTVSAPIPPELAAVVEKAAETIWASAYARSEELIALLRNQHVEQVQELEAERDEAIGEITRLENELETTTEALEQAKQSMVESQLAAERAQAKLEAVDVENKHLLTSLEARQNQLERSQSAERDARETAAELRGRISVLEEQVQRLTASS